MGTGKNPKSCLVTLFVWGCTISGGLTYWGLPIFPMAIYSITLIVCKMFQWTKDNQPVFPKIIANFSQGHLALNILVYLDIKD